VDTETAPSPAGWTTSDPRRVQAARQAHIYRRLHGYEGLFAAARLSNAAREQPLPVADIDRIIRKVCPTMSILELESRSSVVRDWPETAWPSDYTADETGVYFVHATGRRVRLCARFDLVAECCTSKGYCCGLLIVYVGCDGWPREIAIPKGMLHRRGAAFAEFLEGRGLSVEIDEFAQNVVRALFSKLSSPFAVVE
jgi:hypothetical protein